ncbi:hypothetical protein QQP08_020713 [Theobroma cacao]|nr:hypothetical protein QQP08_020713 [Theobroma cacao]
MDFCLEWCTECSVWKDAEYLALLQSVGSFEQSSVKQSTEVKGKKTVDLRNREKNLQRIEKERSEKSGAKHSQGVKINPFETLNQFAAISMEEQEVANETEDDAAVAVQLKNKEQKAN